MQINNVTDYVANVFKTLNSTLITNGVYNVHDSDIANM